jgi:hypothetical protein
MAGAFLGYFFYATTTFVATMALLTCLLDDPRLGIGRHYSRHIITMTITAKAEAHRRLPAKSGTKQASTAKDSDKFAMPSSRQANAPRLAVLEKLGTPAATR